MKRSVRTKILSMVLLLAMIAVWLPAGAAFAESGDIIPPNSPEDQSEDWAEDEFVQGEVLAPADSWEHAETIAGAYGLELKSYAHGIAVLAASDPELTVARSGMMRRGGVPKLGLNWRYRTSEAAANIDYRKDTYSRSSETYDPYKKVEGRRTEIKRTLYNEDDPDDPYDPGQWHHAEMDTERAWALSTGKNVVVAVIDTGIDINHPAFAGRISPKSFNAHTGQLGPAYVRDDDGHGTHVSGIVAASMNNADGVAGVAPNAELLVIKANIPNTDEFASVHLYRAINYAAENGADVINMSLSRYNDNGENADALEQAVIASAVASGVTVVCAAGNWGGNHADYPAAYPESVAVSATREGYQFDNWDSWSNYGPEIDVAAPGGYIYSTWKGGGYGYNSGTSMASPNAAGVAALIKALHPEYTPQQVRDALCGTARQKGALNRDDYYGYGIVNAYAAVLGTDTLCNVVYDFDDGSRDPVTVKAVPGNTLFEPDPPLRAGYAFEGWYVRGTDAAFDFTGAVSGSLNLYAKWTEAVDGMYVAEFPDVNFRREVLRLLNGQGGGRRKESSLVEEDLDILASITWLSVGWMGIRDMTGLAFFTGLEELWCPGNQLTELDVSGNTALVGLYCYYNQLSALDVSNNTELAYLDCDGNQLPVLDVIKNVKLELLDCRNNRLTALDVSKNTGLTFLHCAVNQLTALDVSKNTALAGLYCWDNQLSYLDVSRNTALMVLDCAYNRFTELDTSKNTALEVLGCSYNLLDTLDVSKNTALVDFWCEYNRLTALNVSNTAALESLDCSYNQLTALDVSGSTALVKLYCSSNRLTELDVSKNTELEYLFCWKNQLTALNVSGSTALRHLYCYDNQLTALDVSRNTALESLDCGYNQLTALDVSGNKMLMSLSCYSNQLTALDVSKNTALEYLRCWENQLTSLNVSGSTALEGLECGANQLTALDVSKNTTLRYLHCGWNRLTTLDVSKNTALESLECGDNQLTVLNLAGSTALRYLYCGWNQLTALNVSGNKMLISLSCSNNQLTALDVSKNVHLIELYCSNNYMESPDDVTGWETIGLKLAPGPYWEEDCNFYFYPQRSVFVDITAAFTDPNFRAAVYEIIGKTAPETIMSADVEDIGWLEVYGRGIQSLAGLEYFTGLEGLNCSNNLITALPDLPDNLRYLYCGSNQLTEIPTLPDGLIGLDCFNNKLSSLPALPSSLRWLKCYSTQLSSLPDLPDGLESLECHDNQLSSLPALPPSLTWLNCDANQLASLPDLPDNLRYLYCDSNKLTAIPALPTSLTGFDCSNNQLSSLPALPSGLPWLNCFANQLASLPDLPDGLESLNCSSNVLTSLPPLPDGLKWLDCRQNRLTGFDVSDIKLEGLDCRYNYMNEESDVSGFLGEWDEISFFFWPQHTEDFKAVTNLLDLPRFATAGKPLKLTGKIIPSDVTNRVIEWEILDDSDETGATVEGNVFTAASPGVVYMCASIPGGYSKDSDQVFFFTITVLPKTYTVTFDLDGGTRTGGGELVQQVAEGGAAVAPTVSRDGYSFDVWDKAFDNVRADMTVTAKWKAVTSGPSGPGGSGPTTTPPTAEVTDPTPPTAGWVNPYGDVANADWFFDAVQFVTANGLMNGTSAGKFSPNVTMSRAMLVTVLYRMEGKPAVSGDISFSDVKGGEWYSDAVLWASKNDIVNGYNNGTFGLNDPVTREQAVTILYRYAKTKGLDVSASADLSGYTDMNNISDWALPAMKWAVAAGIIQGRTATTTVPQGTSTRAEVAMTFKRFTDAFPDKADDSE